QLSVLCLGRRQLHGGSSSGPGAAGEPGRADELPRLRGGLGPPSPAAQYRGRRAVPAAGRAGRTGRQLRHLFGERHLAGDQGVLHGTGSGGDGLMAERLQDYVARIEDLGRQLGLKYYPIDFELVPPSFMMEVAVYGLPVRMPHWSFGVRWIYQMVQHKMGHSKIFEVVFPGNPNRAYLVNSNSLEENCLVTAHVLGHADFSHNNALFVRSQREAGDHIVEQAAAHAQRIDAAIEAHGLRRVEAVLDAALALEQHIDVQYPVSRPDYPPPKKQAEETAPKEPFQQRFLDLPGEGQAVPAP